MTNLVSVKLAGAFLDKFKRDKNMTEIKYKAMTEYTIGECEFAIFFYEKEWAWCVLPSDIVNSGEYIIGDKKYSINEILPINVYTYTDPKKTIVKEDIAEELINKGFKYSEKLTCHLNETKYDVLWMN